MRRREGYLVALVLCLNGCGSNAERAPEQGSETAPGTAETAIRAVISNLLKVDPAAIPMDKPICDPPLNADELDLVEIVIDLEERHGVEISAAAIERYAGGKLGNGPIRITPNQLASILTEAPKRGPSKRKK